MSNKMTAATQPRCVHEADVAQRVGAAQTEARRGERTRIAAILRGPEAIGRNGLAQALALDSDITPEAAAKLLASSPREAGSPDSPEAISARAIAAARHFAGLK